jgi:hypothetical protein
MSRNWIFCLCPSKLRDSWNACVRKNLSCLISHIRNSHRAWPKFLGSHLHPYAQDNST